MRIAVLDDYQGVAFEMADWSPITARAEVKVFTDHLDDEDAVVARLSPFDVVCAMRERTPLPRRVLERLPNLKLIASTGRRNAAIDVAYATERGIPLVFTGYSSAPTIELTWALILASVRNLVSEANSLRSGGWQVGIAGDLHGHTLALLGLGNIGSEVAKVGRAFGMQVIAWSQNLTAEKAAEHGAELVTKEALFARADILSVHLVLSDRSRGIADRTLLSSMKKTARLVNTSRGPIVDEAALTDLLREGRIAGAAIDVFDKEPLPADHPFRSLDPMLATPHIGYVSRDLYRTFYGDTVKGVAAWLDTKKT